MRRYLRQKYMWIITFALAAVVLFTRFVYGQIGTTDEKPAAVYNIDAAEVISETDGIEDLAETDFYVDKYKRTVSDTSPKLVKEVDTYSAKGALKERTIYTELSSIAQGITKSRGNASCKIWAVNPDNSETFVSKSIFTVDENGKTKEESIIKEETGTTTESWVEYAYTQSGELSSAAVYSYDESARTSSRISTLTYIYNKNDVLVSSSCTYTDTKNTSTKSEYVSNNQKKPVKVTTTDYDGNVLSREERGYYRTGKIAFYKTYKADGSLYEKMYYIYDKDGDLESTVLYSLSDAGVMNVSEIKIYRY